MFEYPGYVTTRVILPFLNEAMYVVMEGVATAEAVDTSMRLGYGLPVGPLALADRMGLDEVMRWMQHLFDELGDVKYRPCPLLRKMIRGRQAGREVGERVLRVRRGRGTAPGGDPRVKPRRPDAPDGRLPVDPERLRRQFPDPRPTDDIDAYVEVTRRILGERATPSTAPASPARPWPAPAPRGTAGPATTRTRLALRYLAAVEKMQRH